MSLPAVMQRCCWTRLDGISPPSSPYPTTSRSYRCRRNPPNSTRRRTSGSICATTGSPIGCSTTLMLCSITAAMPGTNSRPSHGPSCPSDCVIGPMGPDQRVLVLYRSALSLTLGGIRRFEEFRFDGSQRRFAGRVHRMGQALTITRTDHCAADLRAAASKSDDAAQVRRLLAIALALDGDPRSEAAERSGMDRQTLRDWVHRYNDGGIDGLKSRSSPGRAPRLTDAQKAELKALVIAGPDPEHDGVVRWRCADLQAVIERRFSVQVHESTVGKWLHQLGLTRLQPRPVHPKKDPAAEQAFKKTSAPC